LARETIEYGSFAGNLLPLADRHYFCLYGAGNDSEENLRAEVWRVVVNMENQKLPDPNTEFPLPPFPLVYIKPTIKNKNVIVGDFSYFSDTDFEKNITHFFGFFDEKLIIGKFCQIAKGVEFIMNGANHKMNAFSAFPFYIFPDWETKMPPANEFSPRGDTIIGNDVWIGEDATILPGVKIGDGAIIGAKSVVGRDVEPYTIVVGNPARPIRKRFDDETISLLLQIKWWDWSIEKIKENTEILSNVDLEKLKKLVF
jgi:virginiamycin A acetyltransferase